LAGLRQQHSSAAAAAAAAAASPASVKKEQVTVANSSDDDDDAVVMDKRMAQMLQSVHIDDDDDDDDDEDEEDDDDDDTEPTTSVYMAMSDPMFQKASAYLLLQVQSIMQHMNQGEETPVQVTRTTLAAVNRFLFECVWAPAKGDWIDENDPKRWIKTAE